MGSTIARRGLIWPLKGGMGRLVSTENFLSCLDNLGMARAVSAAVWTKGVRGRRDRDGYLFVRNLQGQKG